MTWKVAWGKEGKGGMEETTNLERLD